MTGAEVRSAFLGYFAERGHEVRPSSPLVPADDPTLLFTNAGMVQFKGVFLGEEKVNFNRAATAQRCVRAGGKHNDLEEVGRTTRHHTFFEMLGNFSFGDYFKRDAVGFAWELVTTRYGLDPDRLYATVHHTDDEAARLWSSEAGVPAERVHRLGDKDNFWQMADTGPCGPCSELHYDLRPKGAPAPATTEEFVELSDAGAILELWNLVFMQFDRDAEGELTPLPAQSVDTGAGLERIASVLQGADSNFHIDLFAPLLDRVGEMVGRPYDRGSDDAVSYRVIADHARAVAFLLADGVAFSNEGRGYVLRRILRRAVRHAWLLGRRSPTLRGVVGAVADTMAEAHPELAARRDEVEKATEAEEVRFLSTVEGGLGRFEQLVSSGVTGISGEEAFRLYDTFGFPMDLTRLMAAERGLRVDEAGFRVSLEAQRERSREDRRTGMVHHRRIEWDPPLDSNLNELQRFAGYDKLECETKVVASGVAHVAPGAPVAAGEDDAVPATERLSLILAENPFYREAGGQVSDTGEVAGDGWSVAVDSVEHVGGASAVSGELRGSLGGGSLANVRVSATVSGAARRDTQRNHTATHLLHAALRNTLGEHVEQRGSLVAPDRLRFDFSHGGPLTDGQRIAVEKVVNGAIWADHPVLASERTYAEAVNAGAMALFGEKYGDTVRVVEIGDVSMELCGGTHVRSTGDVGLFRIVGESGVAAGVRRVQALTGRGAFAYLSQREEMLRSAAAAVRASPDNLERRIEQLIAARKELESLRAELSAGSVKAGEREVVRAEFRARDGRPSTYVGVRLACREVGDARAWGDRFTQTAASGVAVLGAELGEGRHALFAFVTPDLVSAGVHAGEVVKRVAAVVGGRGGGRPHMAQAGVGDPARVDDALREGETVVLEAASAVRAERVAGL